jgi:hypothetical protein
LNAFNGKNFMGTRYLLSYSTSWSDGIDILTALLLSLLRRADQNGTPTMRTVLFVPEDHPATALPCRGFLGTPVGRYDFPHFGRGNAGLPPPNYVLSGERRVYNGFTRDSTTSARLGFGTVVRAVGIRIGFRTPTHEGLILMQCFPNHRISRISVARRGVLLSLT